MPRLVKLLRSFGICISKRQVVRLLIERQDGFVSEAREVLRAGLSSAPWITVDDTGARHKASNGFCTQMGNAHFTWFGTTGSKSRLNFLELLRAGYDDYVINPEALAYMREYALAAHVINRLAGHPDGHFCDRKARNAHLDGLGITALKVSPAPCRSPPKARCGAASRPMACFPARSLSATTPVSSTSAHTACAGSMPSGWFTSSTPSPTRIARPRPSFAT
jgi:hypothetical protein